MSWLRLASCVVMLAGALAFLHGYQHGEIVTIHDPLDKLPLRLGDWRAAGGEVLEPDVLEVLKPTDYVLREYVRSRSDRVWLYVGFWSSQRKGVQIHSPKQCLPGGGWEPLEADQVALSLAHGPVRSLEVNRYVLQRGADRLLVLYWFEAQGEPVAGEVAAKLRMVRSAVWRNRTDGAIVRVSTPFRGDVSAGMRRLEGFVRDLYPSLQQHLPS